MARRKLTIGEGMDLAERAAWQAHGKKHRGWFVGLAYAKIVVPILLVVGIPVAVVLWIVRTVGQLSAPGPSSSTPVSAGPWPWVAIAVFAAATLALWAYRWANPYRGGKALIAGIVACVLLFALSILWAHATA